MYSAIPEIKPGHSGMPALFLPLYSLFTMCFGNLGGGEKESFKIQSFKRKRFGMLLGANEV